MLGPLVILAVLSMSAAISARIGHRFERFLDPVILKVSADRTRCRFRRSRRHDTGRRTEGAARAKERRSCSWRISVRSPLPDCGLAWLLYIKSPELPAKIAADLGPLQARAQQVSGSMNFTPRSSSARCCAISRTVLWQDRRPESDRRNGQ
jgi:hypothetical protein